MRPGCRRIGEKRPTMKQSSVASAFEPIRRWSMFVPRDRVEMVDARGTVVRVPNRACLGWERPVVFEDDVFLADDAQVDTLTEHYPSSSTIRGGARMSSDEMPRLAGLDGIRQRWGWVLSGDLRWPRRRDEIAFEEVAGWTFPGWFFGSMLR